MPFLTSIADPYFLQEAAKLPCLADAMECSKTHELNNILPNTLYITFNAPEVDDYHRGLFITPPAPNTSKVIIDPTTSGTLFHAVFTGPKFPSENPGSWSLECRPVRNVANSKSLVLMFRISSLTPGASLESIDQVLRTLSMEGRGRKGGNGVLGGYSCVLWTLDAVTALSDAGLIVVSGARSIADLLREARSLAGPDDAKKMVGKDFGGLRVCNWG